MLGVVCIDDLNGKAVLHACSNAGIRPAKQNHPARSVFTNCNNFMARLIVLHFMNLPSFQLLVLHTYEEVLMRNRTVP